MCFQHLDCTAWTILMSSLYVLSKLLELLSTANLTVRVAGMPVLFTDKALDRQGSQINYNLPGGHRGESTEEE